MVAKYQFPDLDGWETSVDEEGDGGFSPLFSPQAKKAPSADSSGGVEGWQPLYRPAGAESGEVPASAPTPEAGAQAAETEGGGPAARPPSETAPTSASAPRAARKAAHPAKPQPAVDPKEVERIKARARQEGYEEGVGKGEQEGRARWQERIDSLEAMLVSMGEARERLLLSVREDLVRIMCIVPRKILRQALKIDPRAIVSLVGSVLEELPRQERVVVKVAKEDFQMLDEAVPELRRRLGGYTQVELEASHQIAQGGAEIEMEGGRVEATIERQLETFEERAREWLVGGPSADAPATEIPGPYSSLTGETQS